MKVPLRSTRTTLLEHLSLFGVFSTLLYGQRTHLPVLWFYSSSISAVEKKLTRPLKELLQEEEASDRIIRIPEAEGKSPLIVHLRANESSPAMEVAALC